MAWYISCSVPSAVHMYTVMCIAMYRAEVGLCVYTNLISLCICMAPLLVQREIIWVWSLFLGHHQCRALCCTILRLYVIDIHFSVQAH